MKENKLGTMPIPKLLFSVAFPMIVSMLVQALYNIVDSIFVAKMSEEALTAVSLVFPIQSLMIAVAVGTGVAINALMGRFLGAKDWKRCDQIAQNGLFLALVHGVIFAFLGILGSKAFFSMQTSNAIIADYGAQYMFIVTVFSFGIFSQITFERFLQSTGQAVLSMATQGVGALINIVLDPILIFGLFGFPRLGVIGAGIATVIGQWCGALLGYVLVQKHIKEYHIHFKGFRPYFQNIVSIYQIGIPAILMQSIVSVMVFGLNAILLGFSTAAAAVLGVYFKLQSFVFMPVFGITNAVLAIVAYNYGTQNKERMMHTFWLSMGVCMVIMILGMIPFLFFAPSLLGLFEASKDMLAIGKEALPIVSISFVFAGISLIASSFYQALGNAVYSLMISLARQLVVVLPLAYVLSRFMGIRGIWVAMVIAEIIAALLCIVFTQKIYREQIIKIN